MRVDHLRRVYDYSYWANEKLLGVVQKLTPQEFTRSVAGSYGSIRTTLVHVLSAEWGWLDRCGGPSRGERLDPEKYPTAEALIETWGHVEQSMRSFLATLTDEDLERDVEFALGAGAKQWLPLGDLLHHGALHAAHHRWQVALLLRALGYTPGNFDWLFYAGEIGRVPRRAALPSTA
jgi:uncharacterized damage-inducible protein DinB